MLPPLLSSVIQIELSWSLQEVQQASTTMTCLLSHQLPGLLGMQTSCKDSAAP